MKTKLLKKVRKKYSIKLVHGSDNPNSIYFEMENPAYVVFINGIGTWHYPNFNEAYIALTKRIRKDYFHTKKNKIAGLRSEKIWWVENK